MCLVKVVCCVSLSVVCLCVYVYYICTLHIYVLLCVHFCLKCVNMQKNICLLKSASYCGTQFTFIIIIDPSQHQMLMLSVS